MGSAVLYAQSTGNSLLRHEVTPGDDSALHLPRLDETAHALGGHAKTVCRYAGGDHVIYIRHSLPPVDVAYAYSVGREVTACQCSHLGTPSNG